MKEGRLGTLTADKRSLSPQQTMDAINRMPPDKLRTFGQPVAVRESRAPT
jgi:hypothetical protein